MKLVSWNVTKLTGSTLDHIGEPDVLCLQEIRVAPPSLAGYEHGYSLARDPKNVTYQGGKMYGVATYVRRELGPFAFAAPEWDREGRVLVTVFPERKLAVVNVYAVNGTGKPYFDHELGKISGDRHAFKRRFNMRLMKDCEALRARGLELVLVGDWNISRTKQDVTPRLRTEVPHRRARKEFNETFIPTLDVVDVFRELHPDAKKYTWFAKRSRVLDAARVDYALVSRSMMPRVVSADIDERQEARGASDHAPLSVEWRD